MSRFEYATKGGRLMDEFSRSGYGPPTRSKESVVAWNRDQAAMFAYRGWHESSRADGGLAEVYPKIKEMGVAHLEMLEGLGVERSRLVAEAIDDTLNRGDRAMLSWLWSLGAPTSPAEAKAANPKDLKAMELIAWEGGWRNAMAQLSWCAMAAEAGSMRALVALEEMGVGAADRARVFDGMSKRFAIESGGIFTMRDNHPWVAACALSQNEHKTNAELADAVAAAWRPTDPADLAMARTALGYRAWEQWSTRGMEALAREGQPMGEHLSAMVAKEFHKSLEGCGRHRDATRFCKAAMKWMSACEGPSAVSLLASMADEAEAQLGGKKLRGSVLWASDAETALKSLGNCAALLPTAGKWGKVDPELARSIGARLASAAVATPHGTLNDPEFRAAQAMASKALDKLAGELAPKVAGPKRV